MNLGIEFLKVVSKIVSSSFSYTIIPISVVSLVRLTQEELLKAGKQDTSSKVKFSEADGGGYMAFLEVAHELHCLVSKR